MKTQAIFGLEKTGSEHSFSSDAFFFFFLIFLSLFGLIDCWGYPQMYCCFGHFHSGFIFLGQELVLLDGHRESSTHILYLSIGGIRCVCITVCESYFFRLCLVFLCYGFCDFLSCLVYV